MRAIIGVLACLSFVGCRDFDQLLRDCDAGMGSCAGDAGSGVDDGGIDGGSVDGGSVDGGGVDGGGVDGGSVDGGGLSDAGQATPDCPAGPGVVGATLQSLDGSTAFCFNGFLWENPLPHGTHLTSVWGPDPDDIWAAGAGGMLMHWDGGSWTSHQGEVPAQLGDRLGDINSILATANGVWLAGRNVKPHTLDGGGWVAINRDLGAGNPWNISAMGVSPNGQQGPFAVSRTGDVYDVPGFNILFSGPTAENPDFVRSLAVSNTGRCVYSGFFYDGPAQVHRVWNCDGGTVQTFDAGEPGALWFDNAGTLLVASMNRNIPRSSLWALDGGAPVERFGLAEEVAYTAVSFPQFSSVGFVVGTRSMIRDTSWAAFTTGGEYDLLGVQAFSSSTGSWAVGRNGAMYRQETQWTWKLQGRADLFTGIWISRDGGVSFSGRDSKITSRASMTSIALGTGTLRDLEGLPDGGWVVVSEDGKVWRSGGVALYQGTGDPLFDLYLDEEEAWAVGYRNVAHRQPDGGWAQELPPVVEEWWKIARAGSRFLVAGGSGRVAVYTLDAGWSVAESPDNTTLYGVWTIDADAGTAWVVGAGPSIYRFDAVAESFEAQTIAFGSFGELTDVWGSAPDDVWAVGDDGMVIRFDGTSWINVESGTRSRLERVRSRPLPGGGRELIIVGEFGTVLRKRY